MSVLDEMDINRSCNEDGMYVTDTHAFFYGGFVSNFARAPFTWTQFGETHEFFCTEQAFMWAKAMKFGDTSSAWKILHERKNPMACKMLGRSVMNYNEKVWGETRYQVMLDVNLAKYSQNALLKAKLLAPELDGKLFVEASPTDCIWGIGRGVGFKDIDDESTWRGKNLLGKVITEVRNTLKR